MFTAYFDESGDANDTEFLSMATCVGTEAQWTEFNTRWRAILVETGAPYLHMREFAHSRGVYTNWTKGQRERLMAGCLDALEGIEILMAASAMRVADYRKLSVQCQEEFVGPAFCCFQDCIWGLQLHGYLGRPGEKTDIMYSQQKDFKNQLTQLFGYFKNKTLDGKDLGELRFEDMRCHPALQLADLVAYELRQYYQLRATKPGTPPRYPFRRLCDHQLAQDAGLFRFTPSWKLQFQAAGMWEAAQRVIWSDFDMWGHLISDLAPGEVLPPERILRMMRGPGLEIIENLRRRILG